MVPTPEKRKVGGSTPPLTTSPEQPKRPERISLGAFLFGFDDNRFLGRSGCQVQETLAWE
ncbi:hypothetical protein [Sphaerisporangium perillae]|uniref:hypothetical protein n=1 Tax=Sphaerisporangium perillae TaxID=2935860 RepID=UPI00200C3C23|nr:hypothetical protein [Sphaerisporangium perillae]